MKPVPSDRATVEDYRATPQGPPWYQLVEGDLVSEPAPNRYHQDIVGNLASLLGGFVRDRGLGKVYFAPFDVYLAEHDVYQPDLLFVSNERRHILTDDGARGAPDLVVEIVSPATAQLDKTRKRRIYAQTGVKELWLVDPILRQVHRYDFHRNPTRPVRIIDEDERFETPLLPGLVISTADMFKQ